jgi:hypothetical protein
MQSSIANIKARLKKKLKTALNVPTTGPEYYHDPLQGYKGDRLVLWLVLRWAFWQEGLIGDRLAGVMTCVYKSWARVASDPRTPLD